MFWKKSFANFRDIMSFAILHIGEFSFSKHNIAFKIVCNVSCGQSPFHWSLNLSDLELGGTVKAIERLPWYILAFHSFFIISLRFKLAVINLNYIYEN